MISKTYDLEERLANGGAGVVGEAVGGMGEQIVGKMYDCEERLAEGLVGEEGAGWAPCIEKNK